MKTIINTEKAPGAIGPYCQGVNVNGTVYTSGQLPIDMATGELELKDIKKAAKNSMDNIKAILEDQGYSMDDVVKTLIFITDLADFADINEVYGSYFTGNPPARSCVQVAALPKGAKVEIEAIAIK
ncbi:MAG: RidA family protein [Lachnospirales bacterium]